MEIFQGHEFVGKIIDWLINSVEFDQHYFMEQFSKGSTLTLNHIIKLSQIQNDKASKLQFLPQQPTSLISRIDKQQVPTMMPMIEQVYFQKLIKKKTKSKISTQTNECIQLGDEQQFDEQEYKLRQKKKEEEQLKKRRMKQKEKLEIMMISNQVNLHKIKNNRDKEEITSIFDYNGKLLWNKKTKSQKEKKTFQTKVNSQAQVFNPKHQLKIISNHHKNQFQENISRTIEKSKHQLFEKLSVPKGCIARSNQDCKFGKQIQLFQKTEKKFESLYQKQATNKRNSNSKFLPSLTSIKQKEQKKLSKKKTFSRYINKIKYGQGINLKTIYQLFSINNNKQQLQSRY